MPRTYISLTLDEAKQMLSAAEAKAASLGIPYCVAVVDAGGHLVAVVRQDGALIGSVDPAIDKATTARIFDKTTSDLATLAQPGKPLFGIQGSNAANRVGDLWICGEHRVLCGNALRPEAVVRLLGGRKPLLMVTGPPYGIELDSEWRDRTGLNGHGPAEPTYMKKGTQGHTETTISGDTRADWPEAFALRHSVETFPGLNDLASKLAVM